MRMNVSLVYKDMGTLPKGVYFRGGLWKVNHVLSFQIYNNNIFPTQLGSKHQFCGILVPEGVEIVLKGIMDPCKPCKQTM